jgi:hypothetical protein
LDEQTGFAAATRTFDKMGRRKLMTIRMIAITTSNSTGENAER